MCFCQIADSWWNQCISLKCQKITVLTSLFFPLNDKSIDSRGSSLDAPRHFDTSTLDVQNAQILRCWWWFWNIVIFITFAFQCQRLRISGSDAPSWLFGKPSRDISSSRWSRAQLGDFYAKLSLILDTRAWNSIVQQILVYSGGQLKRDGNVSCCASIATESIMTNNIPLKSPTKFLP